MVALGLLQLWYGKLKLVFSLALVWQLLSIAHPLFHIAGLSGQPEPQLHQSWQLLTGRMIGAITLPRSCSSKNMFHVKIPNGLKSIILLAACSETDEPLSQAAGWWIPKSTQTERRYTGRVKKTKNFSNRKSYKTKPHPLGYVWCYVLSVFRLWGKLGRKFLFGAGNDPSPCSVFVMMWTAPSNFHGVTYSKSTRLSLTSLPTLVQNRLRATNHPLFLGNNTAQLYLDQGSPTWPKG